MQEQTPIGCDVLHVVAVKMLLLMQESLGCVAWGSGSGGGNRSGGGSASGSASVSA